MTVTALTEVLTQITKQNFSLRATFSAMIESVICFCLVCWYGNGRACDTRRINSVIKRCGRLCGDVFRPCDILYDEKCLAKIKAIIDDPSHPMHTQITFSCRSGRPLFIKVNRERHRRSFLPHSIKLFSTERM